MISVYVCMYIYIYIYTCIHIMPICIISIPPKELPGPQRAKALRAAICKEILLNRKKYIQEILWNKCKETHWDTRKYIQIEGNPLPSLFSFQAGSGQTGSSRKRRKFALMSLVMRVYIYVCVYMYIHLSLSLYILTIYVISVCMCIYIYIYIHIHIMYILCGPTCGNMWQHVRRRARDTRAENLRVWVREFREPGVVVFFCAVVAEVSRRIAEFCGDCYFSL